MARRHALEGAAQNAAVIAPRVAAAQEMGELKFLEANPSLSRHRPFHSASAADTRRKLPMHSSVGRHRRGDSMRGGELSFALDALDIKMAGYLPMRGFFVEAGAHDGLTQSNTAMLEFSRGWAGMLVEPIPAFATHCAQHRPRSIVEQAALVANDFPSDTITMTYCNRSSIVEEGRGSNAADRDWIEKCRRLPDQRHIEPYRLTVPAATLSQLLDRNKISHVDFLSLDLEGYEAEALRGLDLTRHRPTFMLIEVSREQAEIDKVVGNTHEPIAELSDHRDHDPPWYDVLYALR